MSLNQLKSRSERKRAGEALRQTIPYDQFREWEPMPDRPDPITLLQAQDQGRIAQLLPIKYGRMSVSPFTFFRGSAVLMASDLAQTPTTGIEVILCGDAHLSNFGVFASPERKTVFDLNDFDEAFPGPWEWDLKRLATSAVLAGRDNGFSEQSCRQLAMDTVLAYGQAMGRFSEMHTLDQWYYHVHTDSLLRMFEQSSKAARKSAAKMVKKAKHHTQERSLKKLTQIEGEIRQIVSDPPLLIPFRDMELKLFVSKSDLALLSEHGIEGSWQEYLSSLPDERRYLLERYEIVDIALRVGGVGSVGTRCIIVLLHGGAEDDAIILQLKEAGPSALEPYLARTKIYSSHAQRVVTAQRVMQATNDIFLGWSTGLLTQRDYYWRQLKDMKGSADIASFDEGGLKAYLTVCSTCLARAHARTGDEIKISGYLGNGEEFADAISNSSVVYANQVERDYQTLVQAIQTGHIEAIPAV